MLRLTADALALGYLATCRPRATRLPRAPHSYIGERCTTHLDCYSRICEEGVCLMPECEHCSVNSFGTPTSGGCRHDLDRTCAEFQKPFWEAGGTACTPGSTPCIPLSGGEDCDYDEDCWSQICVHADGSVVSTPCDLLPDGCDCEPVTCSDGVENGEETDVDCGGTVCDGCLVGEDCLLPTDCQSGVCDNEDNPDGGAVTWTCLSHCDDGVLSGDETDIGELKQRRQLPRQRLQSVLVTHYPLRSTNLRPPVLCACCVASPLSCRDT